MPFMRCGTSIKLFHLWESQLSHPLHLESNNHFQYWDMFFSASDIWMVVTLFAVHTKLPAKKIAYCRFLEFFLCSYPGVSKQMVLQTLYYRLTEHLPLTLVISVILLRYLLGWTLWDNILSDLRTQIIFTFSWFYSD